MTPRTIEELKIVLEQEGADPDQVTYDDAFRNHDDIVCIRHYRDGWARPRRRRLGNFLLGARQARPSRFRDRS